MSSVLQDWVMDLPLREQGTLLTAVRGCDLAPKTNENLSSPERQLSAFVRWCFLNPADPREVSRVPGSWFRRTPPLDFRASSVMHYPLHWYSHVMHALEVVGWRHPDRNIRHEAMKIYNLMVHGLHLNGETVSQFQHRLTEDRIAAGTVVS